jgi:hypothetical protein
MLLRRRTVTLASGAVLGVAAAALVTVSAIALTHSTASPRATLARTPFRLGPPLGRPAPSHSLEVLSTADGKSPWTPLKNPPPFGTPGTMLLESNGTVLVHDEPDNNTTGGTTAWYRLTPDSHGNYADGTWSKIASMPAGYSPLYFASAILPDGRMIVEGGEYLGENDAWTNRGAIYNPVTNSWASVAPPPGWTNIGDAASEVLPNGTFMLQQSCQTCLTNPDLSVADAVLNAKTLKWTIVPGTGKNDPNDEEGWTLEPSGRLLTLDAWVAPQTQLFNPSTRTWSFAGNTAPKGNPVNPLPVVEVGPQVEMPGGNTFVVGAGTSTQEPPAACTTDAPTQTALYHYKAGTAGTWTAGPEIPAIGGLEYDSADGPGSVLPDGNVLFDVSACVYNTPLHFFLYNAASNSLSRVEDVPNSPNDSSFYTRMLALPNGQVLFNDGGKQMEVYTAGGTPKASWRPSISSISSKALAPGHSYSLSGAQLAGLDQGAAYGDDVQDSTNFPIVRLTSVATGVVTYARTYDWTSVSVAPGARSSTRFVVPAGMRSGSFRLVVIANGIASAPVTVTVS